MTKFVALVGIAILGFGCGGGGGGGGFSGSVATTPTSYYFDSKASLPPCDDGRKGALAYIADETAFYHCKDATWNAVEMESGVSVTSNQLINKSSTNLCTQFSTETCAFQGGQLVKLSDGTVIMTGGFAFIYVDGVATDYDHNTVTAIIPPGIAGSYQVLSNMVARGAGYRRLFLAYERDPERVSLGYDANGNETLDAADTLLQTLGVVGW